jgi:hypothetical protein
MVEENGKISDTQPKKLNSLINEDIPLWLQGLEEPVIEDTSPISLQSSGAGWIKENDMTEFEEQKEEDLHQDNPSDSEDDPEKEQPEGRDDSVPTVSTIMNPQKPSLPDWLSDMAEVDPAAPTVQLRPTGSSPQSSQAKSPTDQVLDKQPPSPETQPQVAQAPETNQISGTADDRTDSIDDDVSTQEQEREGEFGEISDFNFSQEPEPFRELTMPEENNQSDDDELPPWLNQMIMQNEERTSQANTAQDHVPTEADSLKEKTQPVQVEEEDLPAKTEQESAEPALPQPETTVASSEEEAPETPSLLFHGPPVQEMDTNPAQLHRPGTSGKAEQESQDFQPDFEEEMEHDNEEKPDGEQPFSDFNESLMEETIPETLNLARELMTHGELDQALEIMKGYAEQSAYLDIMEKWLIGASRDPQLANREVWELLGDISLEKGSPDRAVYAYSKAIKKLI